MKYQEEMDNGHNELVDWKRNVFDLPKGNSGKAFMNELTKLCQTDKKLANRDIHLKAFMVMSSLIFK